MLKRFAKKDKKSENFHPFFKIYAVNCVIRSLLYFSLLLNKTKNLVKIVAKITYLFYL